MLPSPGWEAASTSPSALPSTSKAFRVTLPSYPQLIQFNVKNYAFSPHSQDVDLAVNFKLFSALSAGSCKSLCQDPVSGAGEMD